MKITGPTIEVLADIITGGSNSQNPGYRSGPKLVNFFYSFGSTDTYSSGFPSRKDYTIEKLKEYNDTDAMVDIIKEALNPVHFTKDAPNNEAFKKLNKYLQKDGYTLTQERNECPVGGFPVSDVQPIGDKTVETLSTTKLNHPFINDQITKSQRETGQRRL